MSTVLLVFLIYLVGMVIVGIITARLASKSLDDFILGGKKMWTPVIALSEKGTDMSAWLLIGLPGQAFKMGICAIWAGIVVWYNVPVLKSFLYELIPGFIFSLLATWIVSLVTSKVQKS